MRGLYQGYAAAQLTWLPYFSIYFFAYERLKAAAMAQVRQTPCRPRSRPNFSLLQQLLYDPMTTGMQQRTGQLAPVGPTLTPFSRQLGARRESEVWSAAFLACGAGAARAPSHYRVIRPLIHFVPDSLTYSKTLFLKRQCNWTLGAGSFAGALSPGRHCHSTLALALIDWHCLGIHTVILLPLLPFSVGLRASPRAMLGALTCPIDVVKTRIQVRRESARERGRGRAREPARESESERELGSE